MNNEKSNVNIQIVANDLKFSIFPDPDHSKSFKQLCLKGVVAINAYDDGIILFVALSIHSIVVLCINVCSIFVGGHHSIEIEFKYELIKAKPHPILNCNSADKLAILKTIETFHLPTIPCTNRQSE